MKTKSTFSIYVSRAMDFVGLLVQISHRSLCMYKRMQHVCIVTTFYARFVKLVSNNFFFDDRKSLFIVQIGQFSERVASSSAPRR